MTVVRRVFLVRHAGTHATGRGDAAVDEPLTPAGAATAARLEGLVAGAEEALCSPTVRTRETAEAAGWRPRSESRLAPLDLGLWAGRPLPEIGAADPAGMVRWLADPAARPHGGETVAELVERIRLLLAEWHKPTAGDLIAVTHAAVIRAAVVVALDAPPDSFWRVEVAPASVTELHTKASGWTLFRANASPL